MDPPRVGDLAIAVSGGPDSLALLHATLACVRREGIAVRVHALHVHHALMPQADAWLRALRERCARWRRQGAALEFHATRIPGRPAPAQSIEAWARQVRYDALAAMARECGAAIIWLAQHRRDQAETFVVQALRGSGPAGLAGMARSTWREGLLWERPWLDQPREAIEAYVQRHRLRPVFDPSNADPRFVRSALRSRIWPALLELRPQAEVALARAARRQAQAEACLQALARIDARAGTIDSGDDAGVQALPAALPVRRWLSLPAPRRDNLLRHWALEQGAGRIASTLVERLAREVAGARGGARWPAGAGWIVLRRGSLHWQAPQAPCAPG